MMKAPRSLQDLRNKLYRKAKAEASWRCWGLYVHVCKMETLRQAYRLAKANDGAPGSDGVTFEAVEADGVEAFLRHLQQELVPQTYRPWRLRKVEIPKEGGSRQLSIPTSRDRVVPGALKLILEPIFEADFQPGSYGYRPNKSAHEAGERGARAILEGKTYVIDLDLKAYFDSIRHHQGLAKVARRVNDAKVLHLRKLLLRVAGKRGVAQGSVLSPLLSNLYLTEVDRMLERAKAVTRMGWRTAIEYCRFADDLVVLIGPHPRQGWLQQAVETRLRQELAILQVEVNESKSRRVDLRRNESFGFLGFAFRRVRTPRGKWMPLRTPLPKKRTALLRKLKEVFQRHRSRPLKGLIAELNPILRGWVQYFAMGHSRRCFSFIRNWVEQKMRRHLAKARQRQGFGWKRWRRRWLYDECGLFGAYYVKRASASKAAPAR
jgi:RNA-directed DNA polymerase